jgi:hypothetical protein
MRKFLLLAVTAAFMFALSSCQEQQKNEKKEQKERSERRW